MDANDYIERVYAGVLGKIIGVYLGRPFEGWTYERIVAELGDISYYVHERLGLPLIVTDDDITGTFTFLRALPDHDCASDLTAAQIGHTWLNYLIESRTVLWWGGLGRSTEHTAYLRLKGGLKAPLSGSIATNGRVVAEQIGAQIFIDGWAMVVPGDPERAADLARRAGSVSHDGEAIYAAQVIAAMESMAFEERDINRLLDVGLRLIPTDSTIARVIYDARSWHARFTDWRRTRQAIAERYGYDRFGGGCHVVPNHALILLGLLYGESNFQRSLMICTTSGWDTDCNAGNLGCLLGIKDGLPTLNVGPDWRGPVADRLYLPTADGGRAITDALTEAYHIAAIGRQMAGQDPITPKQGARFHFDMPGSVQTFEVDACIGLGGTTTLHNVVGHSARGARSLAIRYPADGTIRVAAATFLSPTTASTGQYEMTAVPTLYAGQLLESRVSTAQINGASLSTRLFVQVSLSDGTVIRHHSPSVVIKPGGEHVFYWQVPHSDDAPIARVGLEVASESGHAGTVYLDYLTWSGAPQCTLSGPRQRESSWDNPWVCAIDQVVADLFTPGVSNLIQNRGRGVVMTGTQEWGDYTVSTRLTPHMATACGVCVRVQGMRRHYAVLLTQAGAAHLLKVRDEEVTLAKTAVVWLADHSYALRVAVHGQRIRAWCDDRLLFDHTDSTSPLLHGGVGIMCDDGNVAVGTVTLAPSDTG